VTELKYKLRKTEDSLRNMSDECLKKDRELATLKAETEHLKA